MASSLSTLGSNLAERIHKLKSIMNIVKEKKKRKTCGIKYKACECEYNLEYTNAKGDLIEEKCLCRNKNY